MLRRQTKSVLNQFFVGLAIPIAVWSCSAAPAQVASRSQEAETQLSSLLAGLKLAHLKEVSNTGCPFTVVQYSYTASTDTWPHGSGLAVIHRDHGSVLWAYLHHGDFPPHTVRCEDFDGDGRQDLIFRSGHEDVSETHIYFNRIAGEHFGLANFVAAPAHYDAYAAVVDLAGQGKPELLVAFDNDWYVEFEERCPGPRSFDELWVDIAAEYRRMVGDFADLNVWDGIGGEPVAHIFPFEKPRIVSLQPDSWVTEVTQKYPQHLKWRVSLLERYLLRAPAQCQAPVRETLAYIRSILDTFSEDAPPISESPPLDPGHLSGRTPK